MKFYVGTEVLFTFKESIDRFSSCCCKQYYDKFCFGIIQLQKVFTHPVSNAILDGALIAWSSLDPYILLYLG